MVYINGRTAEKCNNVVRDIVSQHKYGMKCIDTYTTETALYVHCLPLVLASFLCPVRFIFLSVSSITHRAELGDGAEARLTALPGSVSDVLEVKNMMDKTNGEIDILGMPVVETPLSCVYLVVIAERNISNTSAMYVHIVCVSRMMHGKSKAGVLGRSAVVRFMWFFFLSFLCTTHYWL